MTRLPFAAAAFLGAALLFSIQPLAGKRVLPLLGGTPAVWNGCLVTFQALLLAGYALADRLARARPARQAVAYPLLLALGAVALPVGLPAAWADAVPADAPLRWLIPALGVMVGPPFVALAVAGPLLGRWFALARPGANPYPLYAASNLGSFAGLLSYPLALEPLLTLDEQARVWAVGYAAFAALVLGCGVIVRRTNASTPVESTPPAAWRQVGRWVALAAVPSSLLAGVTQALTTDIAPVPMLWVVPLGLYLLTFAAAFAARPPVPVWLADRLLPPAAAALALALLVQATEPVGVVVALHLAAFTAAALACHSSLAAVRPPAGGLTGFYLAVAVGGALGGMANTLLAPLLFRSLAEYPLALVLACLLRPGAVASVRAAIVPLTLAAVTAVLDRWTAFAVAVGVPLMAAYSQARHAATFALALGAVLLVGTLLRDGRSPALLRERNFFGTLAVVERDGVRRLTHGTTVHGEQAWPGGVPDPTPRAYYHPTGPLGRLFRARAFSSVAAVGLGAGSVAYYAKPGQRWTLFEIDPAVARVAHDPALFTFLRDCPAATETVLGDARRTLAARGGTYDLIVLDAFSSDAVPVHLLTREAFALYERSLAPGGWLAVHVSNRYLDLPPVVAAVAADAGLTCRLSDDASDGDKLRSLWVVVARTDADVAALGSPSRWEPVRPPAGGRPWTDGYSNVVGALRAAER